MFFLDLLSTYIYYFADHNLFRMRLDLHAHLPGLRESGNIICISLHNLSFLHDMMFKFDFDALYIYFVQKEISYLKKYIPCSQTALVSCKNIV